jgi:hypothetical protein
LSGRTPSDTEEHARQNGAAHQIPASKLSQLVQSISAADANPFPINIWMSRPNKRTKKIPVTVALT